MPVHRRILDSQYFYHHPILRKKIIWASFCIFLTLQKKVGRWMPLMKLLLLEKYWLYFSRLDNLPFSSCAVTIWALPSTELIQGHCCLQLPYLPSTQELDQEVWGFLLVEIDSCSSKVSSKCIASGPWGLVSSQDVVTPVKWIFTFWMTKKQNLSSIFSYIGDFSGFKVMKRVMFIPPRF